MSPRHQRGGTWTRIWLCACLLWLPLVACGADMSQPVILEWDFEGVYQGNVRFSFSDTLSSCEGPCDDWDPLYVVFFCYAAAEISEESDSVLVGVLYPDLGSCTVPTSTEDDPSVYLRVADTIPFRAFLTEIHVGDGPASAGAFGAHGDLVWGGGGATDFAALLGCSPIDSPIGIFGGGDPRHFPPYRSQPGIRSMIEGRTGSGSGRRALCNDEVGFLLASFRLDTR